MTFGGGSAALSGLTAAGATNTINNATYAQTWQWNTLAGATALSLTTTSTAAASNAQKMLAIDLSGTNATSAQTTYGAYITNTHAGTTSTNVGLYASASGGTTANYAALFPAGNVGFGTATPKSLLHIVKAAAPTTYTVANEYMHLGGGEQAVGGLRLMGFGYQAGETYPSAYMGFVETSVAGSGKGELIFGTRNVTTDTQPTERIRIDAAGNVGIGTTSPGAKLDVAGAIKLSDTAQNCGNATDTGAVRFNSSTQKLQYCVNGGWRNVNEGPGVLISTQTASASASLQFNGANWSSSYNTLFLNCSGLLLTAAGGGKNIAVQVGEGAGPTWPTGAHYSQWPDAVTTAADIFNVMAPLNTATDGISFWFYIYNVSSTTLHKLFIGQMAVNDNTGSFTGTGIYAYWNNDTNALTGIQLVGGGTTIKSGTCSLYGMN
jgi:hypothetical protein